MTTPPQGERATDIFGGRAVAICGKRDSQHAPGWKTPT